VNFRENRLKLTGKRQGRGNLGYAPEEGDIGKGMPPPGLLRVQPLVSHQAGMPNTRATMTTTTDPEAKQTLVIPVQKT